MIVNVPTSEDLTTISQQLYFNAWASAVSIVVEFNRVYNTGENWEEEWKGYVEAAQTDLQSIYTLIQQSQEIGIKALIAKVSPFLLLKRHEAKPISPETATYDFTDFPTIDASELVRVHNTFCPTSLSGGFASDFDRLRRERNKIAHLGLFDRKLTPGDLLDVLLKQFGDLYPGRGWLADRVFFASKHRWADYSDYDEWSPEGEALSELSDVLPLLTPAQVRIVWGRAANKQRMVCPRCGYLLGRMLDGNEPYPSQMPTGFKVKRKPELECVACNETYELLPTACKDAECGGKFAAFAEPGGLLCVECGRTEDDVESD